MALNMAIDAGVEDGTKILHFYRYNSSSNSTHHLSWKILLNSKNDLRNRRWFHELMLGFTTTRKFYYYPDSNTIKRRAKIYIYIYISKLKRNMRYVKSWNYHCAQSQRWTLTLRMNQKVKNDLRK